MVYLDSYLGFGQAPKIIYTSKPRPKTLEHKMGIGKWTRNAVLTLAAIVGIQALNPGVKQKEVNIAQTPDGIHEVAPETDKPSFGFGVSQAQAGGDQYFADLPSAVRIIENKSSALLNAYLATRHKMYHKTVYAPHGTKRDELICVSLGLTNTNYNNNPVVSSEERTASPLYFLLRARMPGDSNNIYGKELRNIVSENPTAEHLILGINLFYEKYDYMYEAATHFAQGIFEITQFNQNDLTRFNQQFNINMHYAGPKAFSETFLSMSEEQRNFILNEIIAKKINWDLNLKPSNLFNPKDPNKKWENLAWCVGFLGHAENRTKKIQGTVSKAFVKNKKSLWWQLYKEIGYSTYSTDLIENK